MYQFNNKENTVTTDAQPQFTTRSDEFVQGGGLPLREFWGDLQDIIPDFAGDAKMIKLPFENVEVIETDPGVVWPHPIAEIECRAWFTQAGKARGFGAWFEMCSSSTNLGYPDIMSTKGLRLRMKGTMRAYEHKEMCTGPDDNMGVEEGQCLACGKEMETVEPHKQMRQAKEWRIAEVSGSGGSVDTAGEDDLLSILSEPKNTSEFAQAVLAHPGLRTTYGGPSLYDGNLLAGLVAAGKVKLEGDQYSVV